jgi:hypothetical protein
VEFWEIAPKTCNIGNIFSDLGKGGAHFESGEAGVVGMAFALREGAGPKGHDAVPDELIDDAMITANDLSGGSEVAVEKADDRIGSELFPNCAEARDIRKEDGEVATFSALAEFARDRVDDVGDDSWVEELTEGFAKFFFRLKLVDHGVEGGGEIADFVA